MRYVFLRDLNRQYLSHDTDTDVITFDLREIEGTSLEGEVYIGLEQVRKQAQEAGVLLQEELLRMMAHGVLHLCGYADDAEAARKKMRVKEAYYLSLFFSSSNSLGGAAGSDQERKGFRDVN